MAVMGFNPAMEMSQLRTQQTLAMQGSVNAAPAAVAPTAAAAAPAAAGAPAQAGVAANEGAAADAATGAAAVQPPPSTSKIVLQSVLKGAMTGASVTLGLKSAAPLLGKIPFLTNLVGSLPVKDAAGKLVGKGLLGVVGKLPLIGNFATKFLPKLGLPGLQGFLVVALAGIVVGGIAGAISGVKKAKQAQAEYAEAMAAQQQQQPPAETPVPEEAPVEKPVVKPKYKSWIIAKSGTTSKTGGSFGHYTAKKGDSIEQLAKRFYTTPEELKKLNPKLLADGLQPGDKLKVKRKVVPNATFWKG